MRTKQNNKTKKKHSYFLKCVETTLSIFNFLVAAFPHWFNIRSS